MKKQPSLLVSGIATFIVCFGLTLLFANQSAEKKLEADCPATRSDQSCIQRMRAMGHLLSSGGAWSSNDKLMHAAHWYRRAADSGDAESMFHLGWIYMNIAANSEGKEIPKTFADTIDMTNTNMQRPTDNIRKAALDLYLKSAELGFAPAMNNAGWLYQGYGSVDPNYELSFKESLDSANAGNPMGAIAVMKDYRKGEGIEHDEQKAEFWKHWDPKKVNPRDLQEPTLERTMIMGLYPVAGQLETIRAAAKSGEPTVLWKY